MLKYAQWFWRFWRDVKFYMLGLVFFTVLTISIKTAFPVLLKYIIDALSGDYTPDAVYKLVLIFLIVAVFHEFVSRFLPMSRFYFGARFTAAIRNQYYRIFSEKGSRFFHRFRTGDLLTRLTDDIDGNWDRISWYSCSGIMRPFEAILVLSFTLMVMFYFSWELTLFTFLPLPFLVYLMARFEHRLSEYTKAKQKSISECNNVLDACFSGIRVVKTTLSEEDQVRKYTQVLEDRVQREKDFLRINQLVHFFAMLVNDAGTIIVIFIGSAFLIKEQITLGTLLLFITYLGRLIEPIWTLAFFYASSKQVFRYVDRLVETEDQDQDQEADGEGVPAGVFTSLEFKGVSFGYPAENGDGRNILMGVNLHIRRGEHVALIGQVGTGKTTLLEMIVGNIHPDQGTVYWNGEDTRILMRQKLNSQIGYVPQQSLLFSETINDNLKLGDEYEEGSLHRALEQALVAKEIAAFPDGPETILGQRGVNLSGGQKQRVAIARSLLRRPQLLLLDDCTASMDADTEARFWETMAKDHPETTVVVVTHRKASARQFKRVYHLENGNLSLIRNAEELNRVMDVACA